MIYTEYTCKDLLESILSEEAIKEIASKGFPMNNRLVTADTTMISYYNSKDERIFQSKSYNVLRAFQSAKARVVSFKETYKVLVMADNISMKYYEDGSFLEIVINNICLQIRQYSKNSSPEYKVILRPYNIIAIDDFVALKYSLEDKHSISVINLVKYREIRLSYDKQASIITVDEFAFKLGDYWYYFLYRLIETKEINLLTIEILEDILREEEQKL